jgi:heme/copper-type cytochrome/quinol oxidase subunit 3
VHLTTELLDSVGPIAAVRLPALFDFDSTCGNFDVLLANIGVLTASSFVLTVGHLRQSNAAYWATLALGLVFLGNQVDELFSLLTLSGAEEISLVLFCLFTHLSHLVLSLLFFAKMLLRTTSLLHDNYALFVSAYWHLVEAVWIVILLSLVGF